jgi:tRNA(Ile)-lysidine synthase
MIEKFIHIAEENITDPAGKKFLLAVSGGVDSVVLSHLFAHWKVNFSIAHCNFKLRGSESDDDEKFVKELSLKLDVPFYVNSFNTEKYAAENKVSIQMAARELRYEWFKKLLKEKKFNYLVTAHHRNDQVETFFINLLRGSGIEGLTGMHLLEKNIFRPLLPFGKDEIVIYAENHNIHWREDSSNLKNDYLRNKLRNEIFPFFEKISPTFINTLYDNTDRLKEVNKIYKHYIEQHKELIKPNDFGHEINLQQVQDTLSPATVLFELLRPFHFNFSTVKKILGIQNITEGKKFFSPSHRAVNHKGTLLITRITPEDMPYYTIEKNVAEIKEPLQLQFNYKHNPNEIINDKNIALLDLEKIQFPLILRKWYKGDSFFPLGMKGRKKLSDFFVDNKLSLVEKENIWVLASGDNILWIIGLRIDNRYKITPETKQCLKVELISS